MTNAIDIAAYEAMKTRVPPGRTPEGWAAFIDANVAIAIAPDSGLHWRITRDSLTRRELRAGAIDADAAARNDRVGTCGPGDLPAYSPSPPTPFRFRLLDDDGEVYYYGRASGADSLSLAYAWGMAWAGTTNLEIPTATGWQSYIS